MKHKTKDIRTIFETLTPYKAVSIKNFQTQYYKDNKYYIINNLNEHYILTIYNPNLDQSLIDQDYRLTLEMQQNKYVPFCLYYDRYQKIKITERIYPLHHLSFLGKSELKILANSLRGFHKIKHSYEISTFSPFEVIEKSKIYLGEFILPLSKEKEIINKALRHYQIHDKVVCHNFLLKENIIINKHTYFFNYDYMGYNDPLYDITLLLYSLDIKEEEDVKYFLKNYYLDNYHDEYYLTYVDYLPLVKLTLVYLMQTICKKYSTLEFNDTLKNLISDLNRK